MSGADKEKEFHRKRAGLIDAVDAPADGARVKSELDRKDRELKRSEVKYRSLFESTSDFVAIMDMQGKIIDYNRSSDILGVARENIIGKNFLETGIFKKEHESLYREILADLEKGKNIDPAEVELTAPDGSKRTYRFSPTVVHMEGQPFAIQVLAREVSKSERKLPAPKDIRIDEWRSIFQAIGHPSIILSTDHQIVAANDATLKALGLKSDEVEGRQCYEIFHNSSLPPLGCPLNTLLSSGGMDMVEMEVEAVNGVFLVFCTPLLDAEGNIDKVLHIATDVTQKKRAERDLTLRQAQARALLDSSDETMVLVNKSGVILEINEAGARALNGSPEKLKGSIFYGHLPPELAPHWREEIEKVLVSGKPVSFENFAAGFQTANRVHPVFGEDGGVIGLAIYSRDMSERRDLERQLFHAQKMEAVGRLAAGIAHDFNNNLTPIFGLSELTLKSLSPSSSIRDNLVDIRSSAQKLAKLTSQLLVFGRKQPIEPGIHNLNDIIVDVEKMLGRVIGEDVSLSKSLAPDLGKTRVDAGQIEQIIINLAVNARDAMPDGGKLTIETRNVDLDLDFAKGHLSLLPGKYVLMTVSDTGEGMDEQTRSRVFEPFFTTKERGKGTGLGLSTVYGIVKQNGGDVWVYSEPGLGASFKIYFPIHEGGEETELPDDSPAASPPSGTETVLVVEDDEGVREVIKSILAEYGYRLLLASDGEEAVKMASRPEKGVKLVLTDVVLPGMSGAELASRLKKIDPCPKVVFMSGYSDDAIVRHGVLEPGVDFIQKPFSSFDLLVKVRAVLDQENGNEDPTSMD